MIIEVFLGKKEEAVLTVNYTWVALALGQPLFEKFDSGFTL